MPTQILYWEAYKPNDGSSFFGSYNPFAVSGSSGNGNKADSEKSEMDFLSRPSIWAQYVVAGIKMKYPDNTQQLEAVGKFLFDASFFGFSLDALAASHLRDISQYYVSAEKLLREDERVRDISPEAANHILGMYSVKSRVTIIPAGYGKKEKFVLNTPGGKRNFWKTIDRLLETDEIKRYLTEDSVLTAWANLRDGIGHPPHNIIEEDNSPKERYPLPSVDLFTYAAEMEKKRMEEGRIRQIEIGREMCIQSDLGRIICELIGEVPPKKERQGVLDRVEELVSQYAAVIKQNGHDDALAAELAEVVRRVDVLGQRVNNLYTRKLRTTIRPLERLIRA